MNVGVDDGVSMVRSQRQIAGFRLEVLKDSPVGEESDEAVAVGRVGTGNGWSVLASAPAPSEAK